MKAAVLSVVMMIHVATGMASSRPKAGRPWLGMALAVRTSPTGAKFLYVGQVGIGTPAAAADIRTADIITRIGARNVEFRDELDVIEFVSRLKIGQKLPVTLIRAGTEIQKSLIVGRLPREYEEAWKNTYERAIRARAAAKNKRNSAGSTRGWYLIFDPVYWREWYC